MIKNLGDSVAGGKLKDTTTIWNQPNVGATNESGFTALPGGWKGGDPYGTEGEKYEYLGEHADFWTASSIYGGAPNFASEKKLRSDTKSTITFGSMEVFWYACSVRCIKDP
jgi:uncharacterized protein (TIGR02145 family)